MPHSIGGLFGKLRQLIASQWVQLGQLLDSRRSEVARTGCVLIVDCHSFPSRPLPCDQDQSVPRPHFCIGTDPFHTPEPLIRWMVSVFERMGYDVMVNRPYAGTIVPMAFWQKNPCVTSVMIEVNRSLYMNEHTGNKSSGFAVLKGQLQSILPLIRSGSAWQGRT